MWQCSNVTIFLCCHYKHAIWIGQVKSSFGLSPNLIFFSDSWFALYTCLIFFHSFGVPTWTFDGNIIEDFKRLAKCHGWTKGSNSKIFKKVETNLKKEEE